MERTDRVRRPFQDASRDSPQSLEVAVCPVPQRSEALSLVFRDLAPAHRAQQAATILADAAEGKTSLEGLFEARADGRLIGAIWSQLQPGQTASIWPPQTLGAVSPATTDSLLTAATRYAERSGARIAQALLDPEADSIASSFCRSGFEHLTDLIYLLSLESDFPTAPPAPGLVWEPCPVGPSRRLAEVLERTYVETLDCPVLNGVRAPDDVLAGYAAVGDPAAVQWLLLKEGPQDVGCLLLAGYPADQTAELVYMGLAPEARGRRLGTDLARQAQWLARQAGYRRMVAAVDAENRPALRAYAAAGFVGWDRRSVMVKVFPGR